MFIIYQRLHTLWSSDSENKHLWLLCLLCSSPLVARFEGASQAPGKHLRDKWVCRNEGERLPGGVLGAGGGRRGSRPCSGWTSPPPPPSLGWTINLQELTSGGCPMYIHIAASWQITIWWILTMRNRNRYLKVVGQSSFAYDIICPGIFHQIGHKYHCTIIFSLDKFCYLRTFCQSKTKTQILRWMGAIP